MRQITTASASVTNGAGATRTASDKPSAPSDRHARSSAGARPSESGRFREVIARKRGERAVERRPVAKPPGAPGTDGPTDMLPALTSNALLGCARETSSAATDASSFPRAGGRDATKPSIDRTTIVPTEHGPLSGVRLGSTRGTTHLHAKIAEGRFAGVELRATEHAGRVQITLIASEVDLERRLRAELDRMHDGLVADRARDVSIIVTHEASPGGGAHGRHDAPSRDPVRCEELPDPPGERRATHVARPTARGVNPSDGDEWIF